MLHFSTQGFKKFADASVKRALPKSHLTVLDGMEVIPDGHFGRIPDYQVDGEDYYLYPVPLEWCTEKERERHA